jgi:predicted NBD/HSP70 family sugar kinase
MLGVKTAALPASLRRTNQRTVISLLLRLGSASRADLAKAAGLSQPTAGKITTELLELGIIEEAGSTVTEGRTRPKTGSPRLGRPGQLLRLESHHPRFLAIELGVSETSISALPVSVRLEDTWEHVFPTHQSPEEWLKELKTVARKIPSGRFWGVLVSVPGIVDESAGTILSAPNLHWLEQANLPELIREVWDLPVLLVQEIRALALGHLTAAPGGEDFLLVDFGQGVGGALVLDGKLYSQSLPVSGELGHTPIPGNARACGCGAVGCLETLVSQRGLLESFTAAVPANRRRHGSNWAGLVKHVHEHGLEPWLADTLSTTGKVLAGTLNMLGINRVVLTGSLNDLPESVLQHLAAKLKEGALWARFGTVICQAVPHRRAAGLVAFGLDRLVLPLQEESPVQTPVSTNNT